MIPYLNLLTLIISTIYTVSLWRRHPNLGFAWPVVCTELAQGWGGKCTWRWCHITLFRHVPDCVVSSPQTPGKKKSTLGHFFRSCCPLAPSLTQMHIINWCSWYTCFFQMCIQYPAFLFSACQLQGLDLVPCTSASDQGVSMIQSCLNKMRMLHHVLLHVIVHFSQMLLMWREMKLWRTWQRSITLVL